MRDVEIISEPPATMMPRSPVPYPTDLFPRQHPSANTARLLGLLALGLGPLAGIPAVVLGRLVQKEIEASSGRYTGKEAAKAGVACGWVGTLVGTLALLYGLASRWEPVGIVAIGAGVLGAIVVTLAHVLRPGPYPLASIRRLAERAPAFLFGALTGVIVVGVLGVVAKRDADAHARAEAEARCANGTRDAETALGEARFRDAEYLLAQTSNDCRGFAHQYVEGLIAAVPERAAEHQRRVAEEKAAQQAKRAAEREQEAQSRFPSEADRAAGKITEAGARAREGKWEDADSELLHARRILDAFEGTQVAQATRYVALSATVRDERTRVAPKIEQVRKAREQHERQIAAMEEAKRKREEAAEAARERARERASESSGRVCCCDGTISPTCTYVKRGCCSRHGGVCGCN